MSQTLVTGIKPTGTPHLGNFAGAIQPTRELAAQSELRSFLLIADGHALNSIREPEKLRRYTYEVAATYVAMGLATERSVLLRQSDVPEVYQLANLLACYCSKGMANRAHAYKAAVARNQDQDLDRDAGINMGLFTYPLLMSADILAFDTDVVPVGLDQKQHVELTVALAQRVNQAAGPVLRVPAIRIDEATQTIPGLDGRKMSKSYGNTIPLFCSRDQLQKLVFRVQTDSRAKGEPGDPSRCTLYRIARAFANEQELRSLRHDYETGAGYGHIKEQVFEQIDAVIHEPRKRFEQLLEDREALDGILERGAQIARDSVRPVMARVRAATGLL